MKKFYMFVLVTAMSLLAGEVYAASRTFYFQATALSSDAEAGLVYASFASAAPAEDAFLDSITTAVYSKSAGGIFSTPSNTTATLRLYAQPAAGFRFLGWKNAADAEDFVSTAMNYAPTVTSQKYGNAADPALFTYYAFFEEVSEYFSSSVVATAVGEGTGLVSVALASGSEEFAATMTTSNLANIYAGHTYYLQAHAVDAAVSRFVGWYSDEECTQRISQNATYTYTVTALSTDQDAPTVFPVFAKFELIPYYNTTLTVNAVGEGGVDALLTSNATVDYQLTNTRSQHVADRTEHTYYLRALADEPDMVDFDGWYLDEDCTELLSVSASYTYKVTSTSLDETDPTAFVAYAKFVARNPYQFRNSSFEKWNVNLTEPTPGWSGPASAIGSMAGLAAGSAPAPKRVTNAHSGEYAVQLASKSVIGVAANGNLTTGVMNMGNMNASATSNNNHTVIGDHAHSLIIIGQPDSLEFYTQFKKGENKDYMGSAKVYLHNAYPNFQDPVLAAMDPAWMGYCYTPIPESDEWLRNVGAFGYRDSIGWTAEAVAEETIYALCVLTTNPTAGGSQRDTLVIDDIRLIYNSQLAEAVYAEETVDFTDGAAAVDELFDEENLVLTANGRDASIETAYDPALAILTITVKGADIDYDPANQHVYTIQFRAAGPATAVHDAPAELTVSKVLIDGQIYLIRGERTFDLCGHVVR